MLTVRYQPALALPQSYIDDLRSSGMLPERIFPEQPYARGGVVAKSDRYDAEEIWIPPCHPPDPQINTWWWPTYPWMHSELLVALPMDWYDLQASNDFAVPVKLTDPVTGRVLISSPMIVVWSCHIGGDEYYAGGSGLDDDRSFQGTDIGLFGLVDYRYLYKQLPMSSVYFETVASRPDDGVHAFKKHWEGLEDRLDRFFSDVISHFVGMHITRDGGRRRSVVPPDPMVATGVTAPLFGCMDDFRDDWTFTDTRFLSNRGAASGYTFQRKSLTYGMCLPHGWTKVNGTTDLGVSSMNWWPTPVTDGSGRPFRSTKQYRGSVDRYPLIAFNGYARRLESATFVHPVSMNGLSINASADAFGSTSYREWYMTNRASQYATLDHGSASDFIVKSATPAAYEDDTWSSRTQPISRQAPFKMAEVNDVINQAFVDYVLYPQGLNFSGTSVIAELEDYIGNYCSIGSCITIRMTTESSNFEITTPYLTDFLPRNCLANYVPSDFDNTYGYLWSGIRLRHSDILPFVLDSPETVGALGSSSVAATVTAGNHLGDELNGMPIHVDFSPLWNGQTVSGGFGLIRGQKLSAGLFTVEAIMI